MPFETLTTNNWRWLRAYWFEPCKDALILDGIWPAVEHLCGSERDAAVYFQRHWLGGPHILLGIQTATPDDWKAIAAAIQEYLAAHRSSARSSESELRRRMKSLQAQEHPGETVPPSLQPNNSVRLQAEEPYSPNIGHDALKGAVRTFLSKSTGFAIHWLTLIRDGSLNRQETCLQIMILLAWLADPDRLRSHLSFSSHASAFLAARDRRRYLAQMFAAKYDGPAGQRVRLVLRDSIEKLNCGIDPAPRMYEFVNLLRDTMTDIFTGVRSGRYQPVPAAVLVGDPDRGPINYRRLIELLDTQPALRAWQITSSLLYQVLNQVGMSAADRFLACYLLSRAAEDLFGQSAETVYHKLNATGDHREMFSFFSHLDPPNDAAWNLDLK